MVWVCSVYGSEGDTVGSGTTTGAVSIARSKAEAIWVCSGTGAAYDSRGITVGGGSDDATDDGSEGTGTHNSGGVGCLVSSLNVAPRLLDTGVSVTSTEEL